MDVYSSVVGYEEVEGQGKVKEFGVDAIPVGATLIITEDNALDYAAQVQITTGENYGHATVMDTDNKGVVELILTTAENVFIELINNKDVILDVGIPVSGEAPWAALAMILPILPICSAKKSHCAALVSLLSRKVKS